MRPQRTFRTSRTMAWPISLPGWPWSLRSRWRVRSGDVAMWACESRWALVYWASSFRPGSSLGQGW